MRIDLNYKRPVLSEEQRKNMPNILSDSELTIDYICFAATSVFPNGFENGGQRRSFARLQRRLDDAVDKNAGEVQLPEDEKYLLLEIFRRNPKFVPQLAKYVVVLEDEIDKLR